MLASIAAFSTILIMMKLATDEQAGLSGHYTIPHLAEIVGASPQCVQRWLDHGLLMPIHVEPEPIFDFRQLSIAQSLNSLSASGATLRKLKQEMKRLASSASVPIIHPEGRVYTRLPDGDLVDSKKQLCLEFSEDHDSIAIAKSAAEWYRCGIEHESHSRLTQSIECYREALKAGGPDAEICFALAHALVDTGQTEAAAERYRQVIELDPRQAEAWNNLGVCLSDLGRPGEACDALAKAVEMNPMDQGARYNLADALDEAGNTSAALPHWREYLRMDRLSERAAYAKKRLATAS
jgi:tetratricopeptide (TPR) repeat protein